jgi:uncharacterized protein (TIGR02246 family)
VGEKTPEEVVDGFGAALRAGDVDTATALFTRESYLVTPDSTAIHGRSQIRGFLRQLVGMAVELTIEQRTMLRAGEVAVGSESWSILLGGDAGTVRRSSRATIVLARVDGRWKIAVMDPWRG